MPRLQTANLNERIRELPGIAALLERSRTAAAPPLFLVGGALRDLLLGRAPVDLDIAVEGSAGAVATLATGRPEVHDRFGTATLELDGLRIDVASTRSETYAGPGALPDVGPADINTDLRRRDFTVNAIAIALTGPDAGALIEFPGASADLEAGRLAVLHDASFTDDPTRLLRLARYSARLRFEPAPATLALAQSALTAGALQTVSGTRIGNELRLLAAEPDPLAALTALTDLGIASAIHPGFGIDPSGAALATAALKLLPEDGSSALLALAAACRELPAQELAALLDELAFSASDRNRIVEAAAAATPASAIARQLEAARTPSQVDLAVAKVSSEAFALAAANASEETRRNALLWRSESSGRRLEITGTDLQDAGMAAGPAIGAGLAAARAAMLDGRARTREQQLQAALAAASAWQPPARRG